jgi:hypothetical protein
MLPQILQTFARRVVVHPFVVLTNADLWHYVGFGDFVISDNRRQMKSVQVDSGGDEDSIPPLSLPLWASESSCNRLECTAARAYHWRTRSNRIADFREH